jgi:hypothetical protein
MAPAALDTLQENGTNKLESHCGQSNWAIGFFAAQNPDKADCTELSDSKTQKPLKLLERATRSLEEKIQPARVSAYSSLIGFVCFGTVITRI